MEETDGEHEKGGEQVEEGEGQHVDDDPREPEGGLVHSHGAHEFFDVLLTFSYYVGGEGHEADDEEEGEVVAGQAVEGFCVVDVAVLRHVLDFEGWHCVG